MTISSQMRQSEVGEVRPSQTLTTFGVGSLVDLPNLSVIVMGLEDWPISQSTEIAEERLLLSAQSLHGPQMTRFLTPPSAPESVGGQTNWFDESRQIGVPVAPFPRWMVCSRCRLLAPIKSGLFEPKQPPYRPDKACYVHKCTTQGRSPLVVPARFLVTCDRGHLDDFPWLEFVHRGPTECSGPLRMFEFGPSGEMADVTIACDQCGSKRRLAEVVGPIGSKNMPACNGRRPHLRDFDPKGCDCNSVRPIALGASNLWFPVVISALSVPQAADDLGRLIEENWAVLEKAATFEVLKAFRSIGQLKDFSKYTDEQIWHKLHERNSESVREGESPGDLKSPEWKVLINPAKAQESRTFKLLPVDPPQEFIAYFDKIVLVEKLREVRALVGFTRIMSPRDFDNPTELPENRRAEISRKNPTWLPACETIGEGIFFQFKEVKVLQWVNKNRSFEREFERAHIVWKTAKNIPNPALGYPGIRFVLLHSFAHALIRQLAIECGYTSASISERIYSRNPDDGEPMAGVLIYTSAPDSEGTLGGLCALGEPDKLGRHIKRALEKVSLCSSDPLCSEH
ncbi:MAG: DrmB family protein, partial [Bdellovibrionales bacterium]